MPILAISAVIIAPLLFILGIAFGANFGDKEGIIGGSISDWLTATATVAVTALTFVLAKESWQLRMIQVTQLRELQKDSIRPYVNLRLEPSHVGLNFINVHVSNLGKGIARRVMFRFFSKDGAELLPGDDILADKFFKLAIFQKGFESLGIGQNIQSYLFSFIQLSSELGGKPFDAYIRVTSVAYDIEGTRYENEYVFDFSEYEGRGELGGEPAHNIANELKKIREQLQKSLNTRGSRFGVDVFDATDREKEHEANLSWINEQIDQFPKGSSDTVG